MTQLSARRIGMPNNRDMCVPRVREVPRPANVEPDTLVLQEDCAWMEWRERPSHIIVQLVGNLIVSAQPFSESSRNLCFTRIE